MFSQTLLSEIRDRIPMSQFVGERVSLKKAGRNFKGLCPFHNEKTPSFMVSDEKQIYHCFGCSEGGDVFNFVMKYDGLTFAEAVKQLAERCGVRVPDDQMRTTDEDAASARKKKWSLRVNQIALEWFAGRLANASIGESTRNYLISRGIKSEIWTQLNLGFADKSWDALEKHLKHKGVPLDLAAELGLVRKRNAHDGYYDFFRGRLIFPITSPRGEVIAFGGRTLDGEDDAKYLNSPDSTIFHKSMSVYGLSWAAEHIRRLDHALVVEGYMDVIGLYQAGIRNAVAPLGTALTSGHIRMLARTTRNMTLIFDGDEAGTRAALRTLPTFLELGYMPRAVLLPAGEDPDSIVRAEGAEAFMKRVDAAATLFECFVDGTLNKRGRDSAGTVNAMADIAPMLKQMSDPVERAVYLELVAKKLGIAPSILRDGLSGDGSRARTKALKEKSSYAVIVPSAERTLVELMVQMPELAPRVLTEVSADDFGDGFCRTIAEILEKRYASNGRISISDVLSEMADPEIERELRSISLATDRIADEEAEHVLTDCVRAIQMRPERERMHELNDLIRRAEAQGNEEQLYDLLRRKKEMALEKHTKAAHN